MGEPNAYERRLRLWRSGRRPGDMEDYIVRIYRRGRRSPRLLVGVVEEVGVEGRRAFTTQEELWAILTTIPAGEPGRERQDRPRPVGPRARSRK